VFIAMVAGTDSAVVRDTAQRPDRPLAASLIMGVAGSACNHPAWTR